MNGSRGAAVTALLVATLACGCAQPAGVGDHHAAHSHRRPGVGEHRLVHVYGFPDGERLAPPTGQPRRGWQQAYDVSQRDFGSREMDGVRVVLLRASWSTLAHRCR
jgi:hypothetical protein